MTGILKKGGFPLTILKTFGLLFCIAALTSAAKAQRVTLSMQRAIELATDSSLTAFYYKNSYLSAYWQYKTFRSERLPSLTLNLTPASYSRSLTKRYDSNADIDVYREQRSFQAGGGLSLVQNFDPIGGTFFVETDLDMLRNYGANRYTQFSAVPFKIGYRHNILGYNEFKWNRRIEPMKYKMAQMRFLYNAEVIASTAISYFFSLAQAQAQYSLAVEQAEACDSMYAMGQRRYNIGSKTKSELLQLQLNAVKAHSKVTSFAVSVQKAQLALTSFLGIDVATAVELQLPGKPLRINVDQQIAMQCMKANNYLLMEQNIAVEQAQQNLDRVKKSTRFNASVSASVGYNQQAEDLKGAYGNPMRQDLVSVSVSVPLLDWGVGRGKRNMAMRQLDVATIQVRQKEIELEQDVLIMINELNSRYNLIDNAEMELTIAEGNYKENVAHFQNGTGDVTSLTYAQEQLQTAQNNYVESMYNYWSCYYELRKITLYDFELGIPLAEKMNFDLLNRDR